MTTREDQDKGGRQSQANLSGMREAKCAEHLPVLAKETNEMRDVEASKQLNLGFAWDPLV